MTYVFEGLRVQVGPSTTSSRYCVLVADHLVDIWTSRAVCGTWRGLFDS